VNELQRFSTPDSRRRFYALQSLTSSPFHRPVSPLSATRRQTTLSARACTEVKYRKILKSLFRLRGTVVPGRPYVLQQFFFILFIARSPRSVGRSPRNFAERSETCSIYKSCSKTLRSTPKKIWGKNMLNLARFWTPFHFKRNYL